MIVYCGDKILADKVETADTFMKKFLGLMGKKTLVKGAGLLLHCSSIHCFFMKIPIDALYISKDMIVIGTETIKPWRIGKIIRGTKYVLELNAGEAVPKISIGDRISTNYYSYETGRDKFGK